MVIGASTNREKYGNMAVRAYRRGGWEVLPVNRRADEIEGLRCYGSIAEVPGPIDRATIYLPPKLGLEAVRELAARGDVGEVWLNPGAESRETVEEGRRLGVDLRLGCSIVDIGESPYQAWPCVQGTVSDLFSRSGESGSESERRTRRPERAAAASLKMNRRTTVSPG